MILVPLRTRSSQPDSRQSLCELQVRGTRRRIAQGIEAAVLEKLIEPPAGHLVEDLVELLPRDRLMDEALAAPEFGEVPGPILKLRRHRELPQRQVFVEIGVERLLGTVERTQIPAHGFGLGIGA